ncbi:MAG: nitroreductase family deazaflavin-dependent oxidoreductase [Actinobacteria bacterium]|nr:nitroreductase family deazaflavin-dependent oxidoreductase [Actinomycetota bacterium]
MNATTTATTTTTTTAQAETAEARYLEPDWLTRNVFNRIVRRLTRMGLSIRGSRELRVRGRVSGEWRTTPVNLLTVDGERYLVAPRGLTQWVRNVRAAGGGELRLGRRVEAFRAEELADADKAAVLRPYLRLWKAETGVFFDGLDADATDAELVAAGPKHPVFRLVPAA